MKLHGELQIYALDAAGNCTHAGAHVFKRFGRSTAQRHQDDWESWARGYVDARPDEDFPLKHSIGKTVELRVCPVGHPECCRAFRIKQRATI